MSPALSSLCIFALLVAPGCGDASEPAGKPAAEASKSAASAATPSPNEKPVDAKADPDTPPAADGPTADAPPTAVAIPPVPLRRADAAASTSGKGANNLGFKLPAIEGWYALDGTPKTADFSAAGSEAGLTRDDNLDSGWTCTAAADKTCAVGLSIGKAADVTAVRIYAAAGLAWRDYQGAARPKTVRVHTDAGYVEAKLKDGANHRYVIFDAPISTTSVTVEVVDTYGKKPTAIHVAELEVYGTSGPKRAGFDLDPAAAFVEWETSAWKEKAGGAMTIRQAFVSERLPDGAKRRILRGTAMHGNKGDRFILIEKLFGGTCDAPDGSWILVDQVNRLPIPVGKLGGPTGAPRRHSAGEGFVVDAQDDDPVGFRFAGLKDGELKIGGPAKRKGPDDAVAYRKSLGYTAEPLTRGGGTLEAPPPGCKAGTEDTASIKKALMASGHTGVDPSKYVVCDLPDKAKAVVGATGECGGDWSILLLTADGKVLHEEASTIKRFEAPARGLRLAMMPGGILAVEATAEAGALSRVWTVDGKAIEVLATAGALAVRPPPACSACADTFGTSSP